MTVPNLSDPLHDPYALPEFAPPQRPDEIGRLAGYRLIKLLGKGGMGAVFRAEDEQLQRTVALKLLLPVAAADPVARERFLREARASAALNSDHTVAIFQVGEAPLPSGQTAPFLAMEFLQGTSLEDFLKVNSKIAPHIVARIGREVALGLVAAHARGLIHRDIKPGNIWLESATPDRPQGRVKLLDFGLVLPSNEDKDLTAHGQLVGTPQYMSPEQISDLPIDGRSDLFSLGVVMYRCLTGISPFQKSGALQTFNAILMAEVPPAHIVNPQVPEGLSLIVAKLLCKNPDDRIPTAAQLAALLTHVGSDPTLQLSANSGYNSEFSFDVPDSETRSSLSIPVIAAKKSRVPLIAGLSVGAGLLLLIVISAILTWPKSSSKIVSPPEETIVTVSTPTIISTSEPVEFPKQPLEVINQLKQKNPNWREDPKFKIENNEVTELEFQSSGLDTLEPLAQLKKLKVLKVDTDKDGRHGIDRLDALRGLPLEVLVLNRTRVMNLEPLQGMKLTTLEMSGTPVRDLGPLKGMPLVRLTLKNTEIADLSPLAGMPLEFLSIDRGYFRDLTPLRGMPLNWLHLTNCPEVQNITDLHNLTLSECNLSGSPVSDLSALATMPLRRLYLNRTKITQLDPLRECVLLNHLDFSHTAISDLSPLANLKELHHIGMSETKVSDLSPIADLKLTHLIGKNSKVRDLRPISKMTTLRFLQIPISSDADREILRGLSGLQKINEKSPKDALKK